MKVNRHLAGTVLLAAALLTATVGIPNGRNLLQTTTSCGTLSFEEAAASAEPVECDLNVQPQDLSWNTNCTLIEEVCSGWTQGAVAQRG